MEVKLNLEPEELGILDTAIAWVTRYCVDECKEEYNEEFHQTAQILLKIHKQLEEYMDQSDE